MKIQPIYQYFQVHYIELISHTGSVSDCLNDKTRLFLAVICKTRLKDLTDITNQTYICLTVLNGILVNIQQRALSVFKKDNVNYM